MIRSIQNRINLLIALIGVAMVVGVLISRQLNSQRIESLLEKKKAESSVFLNRVVDFKSKSLSNFAYDYTFWDEMVLFTTERDSAWAHDNIDISLPTFEVNYAWIFRADRSLIYAVKSKEQGQITAFPLSDKDLETLVATGPFYEFFLKTQSSLIQFSGGSIHPSFDQPRKTKPSGYFFIARIWDSKYIASIQDFTGTKLSILNLPVTPAPVDSIHRDKFQYVNFKSFPDWNGDIQAYLRSTGVMNIAQDFENRSQNILLMLVLILIGSLAGMSFILIRIINRPLRNLVFSLKADDPEPIQGLLTQRTEFGQIAQLMNKFFIQKKKLVGEIEERIKVEAELIVAKDKAEESDRLKTAFLHNISHEIRTPMNAIIGFSELITDPRITEKERIDFTGIIADSSYRLLGIITDLISISTIESGQLEIIEDKICLNSMLQGIYDQFKNEIDHKKVVLDLDVALRDEHSVILSDLTKLNQIIHNLVNNSVKFTNSGRIVFGYTIRNAEIEFFVHDTGIGIPAEKFEAIFARFQQADDSTTRQYGGAGLGLPISKAYVELMGGRIWLKSEEGVGTQFYFTIPYKSV